MSINILPSETLEQMKGQAFTPQPGEGIVYIKLVMIKPVTMKEGDPTEVVDNAAGVVLCGQLSEVKAQLNTWFDETAEDYPS